MSEDFGHYNDLEKKEEVREMASGQPQPPPPMFSGITQFSGMNLPEVMASSAPTLEKLDVPKVSGPEKPPQLVKANPADMKKLGRLVQDEEVAKKEYERASRRRDLFCVDMEKEYGLIGKVWKVNFKTGMIEVTGDR